MWCLCAGRVWGFAAVGLDACTLLGMAVRLVESGSVIVSVAPLLGYAHIDLDNVDQD